MNSFLEQPSWVGPSYLGALLDAAEREGYSVFVVRAAENSRAVFQSSVADECAATLPHASVEGNGGPVTEQGLRPKLAFTSSSTNTNVKHTGQDDEEADLQAALRASMAGADLGSSSGTGASSSRVQSPTVVGQRRFRGGNSRQEDSFEEDEEETDAHVDAIAPSRRRARGLGPGEGSSLVTTRGMGVPYILPTASGGRRRASRLQNDEDERASSSRAARAFRRPSGSNQHPISVDDDDDSSSGRLNQEGEEIDDVDDFEELNMATSAPRSPFLNPALVNIEGSGNNTDDDFHSISSGEGNLEESWIAADAAAIQRQALINDRSYDDEDAQLQAALAASMRESEGSGGSNSIPTTADWISEEDSKAIREAQMASWTTMARQGSDQGPTPADVAKIARMRAEARQKAEDERMGITSQKVGMDSSTKTGHQQNDDENEDDEDTAPQMSPEEMRRARLARFGAS